MCNLYLIAASAEPRPFVNRLVVRPDERLVAATQRISPPW
jgi:hypothetical protein